MVIGIETAVYISGYKIHIQFSDGVEQTVDFENFLKGAKNPMTKKYLNETLFPAFSIQHGDLMWNDFEMCFPIWHLHEGRI